MTMTMPELWIVQDELTAGTGREMIDQLRDEGFSDGEVAGIVADAAVELVKDSSDPESYLEDIIELMRDSLGG